jgi:hypothetical protein
MNSSPLRPSFSAIASAAGITELPGCALVTGSTSSVSSAWAHIALASAALIAVVRKSAPITEACGSPPSPRTYFTAMMPGVMREPDTMAPKVSRIRCLHATVTTSGSA